MPDAEGSPATLVRRAIGHPVVDADGHLIPYMPALFEMVAEIAGRDVERGLRRYLATRRSSGPEFAPVRTFFGVPAKNTLDRMTATLPGLLYERMDEFGIDVALLYPTGLSLLTCGDDEIRRAAATAYNRYVAEVYRPYGDRLVPVAMIPTFDPSEAVEEVERATALGLRAVVMSGVIPRQDRSEGAGAAWIDTLGHGSRHDYDPLWGRLEQLGLVAAFHGLGYGWGSRMSTTNYVYNHLGSFAVAQEAVCRSLLMGGVPRRFPDLRFAFLEGGVAWAVQLLADVIGHYGKRNRHVIRDLDPASLDVDLADRLFDRYAEGRLASCHATAESGAFGGLGTMVTATEVADIDDFAESLVDSVADIVGTFSGQFYFGCEADDPLNGLAFSTELLPSGTALHALFASDIGHWDVPDMRDVLPEAWELVEHGHLNREQFRDFSFANAVWMLGGANPNFFEGTIIADDARSLLNGDAGHGATASTNKN